MMSVIGTAMGIFIFMSDSEKNQEKLLELLMQNIWNFFSLFATIYCSVLFMVLCYNIFIYEMRYELEKQQLVLNEKN